MGKRLAIVGCLLLTVAFAAHSEDKPKNARALAQDAIKIMRDHPYEGDFLQKAADEIKQAGEADPNEPYVWIAGSQLIETSGYNSGDPYKLRSYDPVAVNAAAKLAEKAVALGPQVSDAHAQVASVYITLNRFTDAKQEIYTAHQLDPEAFRPWYLQAVWYWYQGQAQKCEAALAGAEARADTRARHHSILAFRADIAQSRGNAAEEERLLRQIIDLDPGNAWAHGNYALFLMRKNRYDASVAEYEKAVSIAPYPIAVDQLEKAKALRDQERKRVPR